MIKHWEILENIWTANSVYVLGISGDDGDADLIRKELSSFCSLIDVQVPKFTHIFELPNVADEDILQRIRKKIEGVVRISSSSAKANLSQNPLIVNRNPLDMSSEEVKPEDIFSEDLQHSTGFASSDGTEIDITQAKSSSIENTQTFKDILSPKDQKQKTSIINPPQKEEKKGFFKKLFSFSKKQEKEREENTPPLPIEKAPTKIQNIVPDSSVNNPLLKGQPKRTTVKKTEPKKTNTMHGVVVKGTAFPVEDLGAQKIKEVTFDSKTLFEAEQPNDSLQAKMPIDDIFAAETICKFYDDGDEKTTETGFPNIVESAPAPTPKTVSQAPKAPAAPIMPQAPVMPKAPQAPKAPVAPIMPQAPVMPKAPQAPKAPAAPIMPQAPVMPKAPQAPKAPVAPIMPQAPVMPKAPQAPKAPAAPIMPQAPVMPKAPQAPKAPVAPIMPQAPVMPKAPQAPKAPVAPIMPQAPVMPKAPQAPKAPITAMTSSALKMPKEEKTDQISKPVITEKLIPPIEDKGADVNDNMVGENKKTMNNEEQKEKQIPQISVSAEETFKVKNPIEQDPPANLPTIEVNSQDLKTEEKPLVQEEQGFTPLKQVEVDPSEAPSLTQYGKNIVEQNPTQQEIKKPIKPIVKEQKKAVQGDVFDHTIQTAPIPIYKKSNWTIEMPIIPSYTLDNMDMSSNRFAHAAAMSIIENPGTMHNPFFVSGESGCGKTHFLNAIGAEFAKRFSSDQIFLTNGVRFSRGIQCAIEDGSIDKVKALLDNAQVFIIDDIHLTAVNETNREFISKVLNELMAKKKQIVISSKYPPQGLSKFEELINFKLSQGWKSELKTLRPAHFMKAYNKMANDAHMSLTDAQSLGFFGRENLTLGTIDRDIKRAKVLYRRIQDSGSPLIPYEQLLNYITAVSGEDTTSQIESMDINGTLSIRRGEDSSWGNFGFFFPKDNSDKFKWIVYATMRRAKELGIKGGFNFALKSAYSTEHIIASAFKIANICDSKGMKAAIILGPDPKIIQPAIRDNFCDILSHMLEVMMIRCAIIPYEDIKKPSSYVKVLGDVLK